MRHAEAKVVNADGVIKEFEQVWQAEAAARGIPSAQAIDPTAFARLMPHMMLLEVVSGEGEQRFRTRLVGAEHREVARGLHAGDILDEIDAQHAERARVAAMTGRPVFWRAASDERVSIGDFPFAADGRTVDRVVSIVHGVKPGKAFIRQVFRP